MSPDSWLLIIVDICEVAPPSGENILLAIASCLHFIWHTERKEKENIIAQGMGGFIQLKKSPLRDPHLWTLGIVWLLPSKQLSTAWQNGLIRFEKKRKNLHHLSDL